MWKNQVFLNFLWVYILYPVHSSIIRWVVYNLVHGATETYQECGQTVPSLKLFLFMPSLPFMLWMKNTNNIHSYTGSSSSKCVVCTNCIDLLTFFGCFSHRENCIVIFFSYQPFILTQKTKKIIYEHNYIYIFILKNNLWTK